MDRNFPQKITSETQTEFTVSEFGLYAISITASCQKDQDLKVEIDGKQFREIPATENVQTYNVPPAWNGAALKGFKKTVIFLLRLNKGKHAVNFFPKTEVTVEDFNYEIIPDWRKIDFNLELQAQDGDRRPWVTFVLYDLPLESVTAEASVSWHWFDGDDVKLIIDADRTPTLHQASLNLGNFELKRTPTKNDPKWTGDFADDTDIILLARLILGEMEGQPREAKLGAGFTVMNRLKKSRSNWGRSIHEIILKENQYDAFWNKHTREGQGKRSCVRRHPLLFYSH